MTAFHWQTLAFLHSHDIAHLDVAEGNFTAGPWSYIYSHLKEYPSNRDDRLPHHVRPPYFPRFAILDFGESKQRPANHEGPFLVDSFAAQIKPPEMTGYYNYPCFNDPFPMDVFAMGACLENAWWRIVRLVFYLSRRKV